MTYTRPLIEDIQYAATNPNTLSIIVIVQSFFPASIICNSDFTLQSATYSANCFQLSNHRDHTLVQLAHTCTNRFMLTYYTVHDIHIPSRVLHSVHTVYVLQLLLMHFWIVTMYVSFPCTCEV